MDRLHWIILSMFVVLSHDAFSGEIYQWTDEKGTVHFTDDLSKIPRPYLGKAKKSEIPADPPTGDEKSDRPKQDEGLDRVNEYLEDIDKKIEAKKKLEKRISELEEELRSSEERIKEIEKLEEEDFQSHQPFKDPKRGKWVPVGSAYFDEKGRLMNRMEDIGRELGRLQEKLSEIKRSL